MLPSVPDISERRLPLMILNPYEDSGNIQHAKLGRSLESARGLMVNQSDDLLKFKRAVSASASASDERHHYGSLQEYSHTQGRFGAGSSTGFKRSLRGRRRGFPPIATRSMDQVSRMPPGFALGIEFAGHDKFLFRFCKSIGHGWRIIPCLIETQMSSHSVAAVRCWKGLIVC